MKKIVINTLKNNKIKPVIWLTACIAIMPVNGYGETLKGAVERALNSNPDVLAAVASYSATTEQEVQARAGFLPVVNIGYNFGLEHTEKPEATTFLNHRAASFTATQNLFDGFSTTYKIEKGKAMGMVAYAKLRKVLEKTALKAAEAYLEVVGTREVVKFSQENMDIQGKILEQIRAKSEAGAEKGSDVTDAEGKYTQAWAGLISAMGKMQDAEATYLTVVGEEAFELEFPTLPEDKIPNSLEDALRKAGKFHPSLRVALNEMQVARFENRGSGAAMLPTLDFEVGAASQMNVGGTPGSNNNWRALMKMNYNVFRGGHDQSKRRETAGRLNESSEKMAQAYRKVEETLKLAWNGLLTSQDKMEPLQHSLKLLTNSRNSAREEFEGGGEKTLQDILGAENALFGGQVALTQESITYLKEGHKVLAGMGKLLSSIGIETMGAGEISGGESGRGFLTTSDQSNERANLATSESPADCPIGYVCRKEDELNNSVASDQKWGRSHGSRQTSIYESARNMYQRREVVATARADEDQEYNQRKKKDDNKGKNSASPMLMSGERSPYSPLQPMRQGGADSYLPGQ